MNHYRFDELIEGLAHRLQLTVTGDDIRRFADLTGDVSPIHVNEEYARSQGFNSCVCHGVLLTGFVSRFVGVLLPGSGGVLQKMEFEFRSPCYAGDRLVIDGEVIRRVESLRVVILKVTISNADSGAVLANGKVQSGLRAEITEGSGS